MPPTTPLGFTVSTDLVRGLIDCLMQCGLERSAFDDVLQDEQRGPSPTARFAGERHLKLWERILRVSQDPIIGFKAAQFASVKTFGVVGQIGSIARPAAVDRSVSARPLRAVPGRP